MDDYSVRSVRVCRPEAAVSSVRTASATSACSAGRSVSQSPLRTSSPCGAGAAGCGASSLTKSSSSSSTNYSAINTGLKASFSSVSAGGGAASCGAGGGGFSIGGGGVTQTKDYYVKSNLGGGGAAKASFGGSQGASYAKTTTDFGAAERTRQYSATSMRQHEEAATIVTKVIREDTSIMEGKINELSDVTAALQQNLCMLNSRLDGQSEDCNSVKGQLDNFVAITSEIKEVVQSLSVAMGEVKADVHSLHHSISACDQRIDGLESGFESRFESLSNNTGQMDNQMEQIRAEMADRAKLLEQQEASMRELEDQRHALYHAEENLKNKDSEILGYQDSMSNLDANLKDLEHDLLQKSEALSGLEQAFQAEQGAKGDNEKELNNLRNLLDGLRGEKEELHRSTTTIITESRTDISNLQQLLEQARIDFSEADASNKRERQKSDHLQQSVTDLRRILEEEQRRSDEQEKQLHCFSQIVKETKEMYISKEAEAQLLREEISHYKSLVQSKEKELYDLTAVFNENMTDNKSEVSSLRSELREFKTQLREKESMLQSVQQSTTTTYSTHSSGHDGGERGYKSGGGAGGGTGGGTGGGAGGCGHSSGQISSNSSRFQASSPAACRSPSPTLGYCQTHKSIVSLDSRQSAGGACGSGCGGQHGILNIRNKETGCSRKRSKSLDRSQSGSFTRIFL